MTVLEKQQPPGNDDSLSSASLPAYSAQSNYSASTQAPPPSFPTMFKIDSKSTSSLVSIPSLKDHLALLGAFFDLRKTVEQLAPQVEMELQAEVKWSIFIAMAVWRFELWIKNFLEADGWQGGALPLPLDVGLVWHAYALNPRWYQEDSMRHLRCLSQVQEGFPLAAFVEALPATSSPFASVWEARTLTPYNPVESFLTTLSSRGGRFVMDPRTRESVVVPWITPEGTGYAQQQFEFITTDGFKINHEVLGVAKLANDLVLSLANTEAFVAGTVFGPSERPTPRASLARSQVIKHRLLLTMGTTAADLAKVRAEDLAASWDWSLAKAGARVSRSTRAASSILLAYTRGEPFSLDLVGAVLRQGSFIEKMVGLGWTQPTRFSNGDETVLQRSIARYHAFLELILSSPGQFHVPTLDIDLSWHTHQLNAYQYREDVWAVIGRFLDHNDKVEEGALADGFDLTAKAWKARYNVPYSTCGCPAPDDPVFGKFASKFGLSGKKKDEKGPLVTGAHEHEDAHNATHASEHNAVHVATISSAGRSQRIKVHSTRLLRDEKLVAKGKLSPAQLERARAHEASFLYPVPMMYGAYGVGLYGIGPVGGCAVVNGGMMGGTGVGTMGGCAVGAGACGSGGGSACGGGCGGGGGGCGGGGGGCGGGGGGGGGCGGGGGGP